MGVILQSVSVNLKMFIAARFFLGFGIAIAHGSRYEYLIRPPIFLADMPAHF